MNRPAFAIALGVAAAAAAAAVVTATGADAGAPTTGTFTVQAHHGTDSSIDLGSKGFSAGDEDLSTALLTRDGQRVGSLTDNCITARVGKLTADQLCEFDLKLGSANQLIASGAVSSTQDGPGTFTLAITGGTGRYRGASGQLSIVATNGSTVPITVSLDQ